MGGAWGGRSWTRLRIVGENRTKTGIPAVIHASPEVGISRSQVPMALKFTTSCLEDSIELFRYYKKLAERAMAQVSDEQLFCRA